MLPILSLKRELVAGWFFFNAIKQKQHYGYFKANKSTRMPTTQFKWLRMSPSFLSGQSVWFSASENPAGALRQPEWLQELIKPILQMSQLRSTQGEDLLQVTLSCPMLALRHAEMAPAVQELGRERCGPLMGQHRSVWGVRKGRSDIRSESFF